MKKKILTLSVLMASAVQLWAADGLTATDVTVPQGGNCVLSIQLNNTERQYGGFEFELKLPQGISATAIEKAERLVAIEDFSLSMNMTSQEENIYKVLGYNTNRQNIGGTSGDIVRVTLHAEATLPVGSNLQGLLQEVVLSTIDTENIDAENYSFAISIIERPERVVLSETSTEVPEASSGLVDVHVERTVKGGEWNTLCLPFSMTAAELKQAFGNDLQLVCLNSWSFEGNPGSADHVTLGFAPCETLEANVPYLIKTTNDVTAFDVDNVTIAPDEDPQLSVDYKVGSGKSAKTYTATMYGVLAAKMTDAQDIFLAGGQFWYSTGQTAIKAFRATLWLGDVVLASYGGNSAARIAITIDGDAAGISNNVYEVIEDNRFYDLKGLQVEHPDKGLYIQNGKKVVIRK